MIKHFTQNVNIKSHFLTLQIYLIWEPSEANTPHTSIRASFRIRQLLFCIHDLVWHTNSKGKPWHPCTNWYSCNTVQEQTALSTFTPGLPHILHFASFRRTSLENLSFLKEETVKIWQVTIFKALFITSIYSCKLFSGSQFDRKEKKENNHWSDKNCQVTLSFYTKTNAVALAQAWVWVFSLKLTKSTL